MNKQPPIPSSLAEILQSRGKCSVCGKWCRGCLFCYCSIESNPRWLELTIDDITEAALAFADAYPTPQSSLIEQAALAMLNRGRAEDGHPLVASFDGFDEEAVAFWRKNASAALAVLHTTPDLGKEHLCQICDRQTAPDVTCIACGSNTGKSSEISGVRAGNEVAKLIEQTINEWLDSVSTNVGGKHNEEKTARWFLAGNINQAISPYLATREPVSSEASVEKWCCERDRLGYQCDCLYRAKSSSKAMEQPLIVGEFFISKDDGAESVQPKKRVSLEKCMLAMEKVGMNGATHEDYAKAILEIAGVEYDN